MSIKTRLAKLEEATQQSTDHRGIVLVISSTDSEEVINAKRCEAEFNWLSETGLTEIPSDITWITIRGVTPEARQ